MGSLASFPEQWAAIRQGSPFKANLLPLIEKFCEHDFPDMVHLDELDAYGMSTRVVWTEGNPIPNWFMVNRGGLHVSHHTKEAPWKDTEPDYSVVERVPTCPVKWDDTGYDYEGEPGYTLVLGGDQPEGRAVRRLHPLIARSKYSLRSQLYRASSVYIDNGYSGLILTAMMMGKKVTAPRGGFYGPLLEDQSFKNVVKCLTWLEVFSVDVNKPDFVGKVWEKIEAWPQL